MLFRTRPIFITENYIPTLKTSLEVIGLELIEKKNPNLSAQYFGFIAIKEGEKVIIKKVEPNSVTDKKGIAPEDEIKKVNGKAITTKISDSLKNCKDDVTFTIKKKFSEETISLEIGNYYKLLEIMKNKNANKKQCALRKVWCNN